MPPVPRTLSEIKIGLHDIENWTKKYWEKIGLENRLRYKGRGKKFYFLDGPPYASARTVHLGTIWNKVIKDSVVRYKRMRGYDVWVQPGYDTHGLPIEVKVEQLLGLKTKKEIEEKIGVANFVLACKEFARENMQFITKQFKEMGVSLDWESPYITYEDSYISAGWWLIKKAWEQGLLEREFKVVHWCPRCETTLADYEVSEYVELEDPSIYVKFKIKGSDDRSLLIWTTTPWTLPANSFVMAHPNILYAEVKAGDDVYIIAKARVPAVMKEAHIKDYEIVNEYYGKALEGLEYEHPLEDEVPAQRELKRYHKVVLTEEGVSESEGTGLVHSAPGHGEIDQEVGRRIGSPIVSLVDEKGLMTPEAGSFSGLYFRVEANKTIMDKLREKGALVYAGKIRHRYPVCWRCKTPLVLRATSQWVLKISRLREELLRESEKIRWVPDWAKTRFKNILMELKDWILSRQRFWGIPLPIWICRNCNHIKVIGSLKELETEAGTKILNGHRPWVDEVVLRCPKCGGPMKRVPDVIDVWFDSGISFFASLGYPERPELYESLKPVDFIVEGHDQIRGWFFSLFRSGIIAFKSVPYDTVLVHGFMLDEQGREMHKSLGNYVELEDLLGKYSRDTIRLMLLSSTVWEDLRFNYKSLELAKRDLNIILNVYSFASTYMGLDRFDPCIESQNAAYDLLFEDRWMLSRLNRLIKEYLEAMEKYEIHKAVRLLRTFMIEDVSHWYIRLIRRRVWMEENVPEKLAAYSTLYRVLKTWVKLASPFIPHIADYLYINFISPAEIVSKESVHLDVIPEYDVSMIDDEIEERMELVKSLVEEGLRLRMKIGINVRKPLKALYVSSKIRDYLSDEGLRIVTENINVKKLEPVDESFFESLKKPVVRPNLSKIGSTFRELTQQVLNYIDLNGEVVIRDLLTKGKHTFTLDERELEISREHVDIEWSYPEGVLIGELNVGKIMLDTTVDEELYLEGLAREILRRIQVERKVLEMPVESYIDVCVEGDTDVITSLNRNLEYIKGEVRARKIEISNCNSYSYRRKWDIDGYSVIIHINKV